MHQDLAETIFFQRITAPVPPTEDDVRIITNYIASSNPWRSLANDVMNAWACGNTEAEIQLQLSCVRGVYDCLVVCVDEQPLLDLGERLLCVFDAKLHEGWEAVSLQSCREAAIANIEEALRGLITTANASDGWNGDRDLVFRAFANLRIEADTRNLASH